MPPTKPTPEEILNAPEVIFRGLTDDEFCMIGDLNKALDDAVIAAREEIEARNRSTHIDPTLT